MREIKFRGKRVDNGEWVYGYYFKTPLTDEATGSKPEEGWFFLTGRNRFCIAQDGSVYEVILETIGQFTGLYDKNGKEIYEGHIVKCTDGEGEINEFDSDTGIGQVEWIEKWGFWNISEVENGLGDILIIGYVEVIGNIFDNPELLESEE